MPYTVTEHWFQFTSSINDACCEQLLSLKQLIEGPSTEKQIFNLGNVMFVLDLG